MYLSPRWFNKKYSKMRINWSKQFRMAFHSLKQYRLRSILSMLGVIFGIISIVTLLSVGEGAKRKTLEQIEQLGVNNIILRTLELTEAQELHAREHLSFGLSNTDILRIRRNAPFIESIAPIKEVKASVLSVGEELYPEIIAASAEYQIVNNFLLEEGRFLCDLDSEQRNFICVLGYEIAKRLGPKGLIGEVLRVENEMFKVIGILKHKKQSSAKSSAIAMRDFNRVILIPLNTESYLYTKNQPYNYSEIIVKVSDKNKIFAVANVITSIINHAHQGAQDYQIIVPQELINKQKQTQTNFNIFLCSIAIISLIVGGIGIMNIMLATVSERTHEIGIRRALGANQEHIKWQFLSESILISISGGIIGLIIGIIIVISIAFFGEWNPIIKGWIIFLSLSMALIVGLFSGLYPAIKASKMDPIEALRYE